MSHGAVLDGTTWWIEYRLYQKKNLSLIHNGEKVGINPLGDNSRFLMTIHEEGAPSKNILFQKKDGKSFHVSWDSNRIDISRNFTLDDDDRIWSIQGYIYEKKNLPIKNGDQVEIISDKRYLMTFPGKEGSFIFRIAYANPPGFSTWDVDNR